MRIKKGVMSDAARLKETRVICCEQMGNPKYDVKQ